MKVIFLQDWTSVTLFISHIAHFPLQVLPVFPRNITATEAFPLCALLSVNPD